MAALTVLGGCGGAAGGATLKANYQLQGSRTSQLAGAPDLADVGPGNRFSTETVDGIARQVLAFPRGGGVSLPTAGLVDPSSHSIVVVLRLADVSGYRRLLDFSDGASDDGLYNHDGNAVLYVGGNRAVSPDTVFDGSYVQVTLTSEATPAGSQWTTAYVNGAPVAAATTMRGFGLGSGVLRFFKDNVSGSGSGEESAGAVACVLVYDGALTADEVRRGTADRTLCPAPRPTLPRGHRAFKARTYAGTTSQGLPISFRVDRTSVQYVSFKWRAKCADGRVHTNGIGLGGTRIRGRRFSVHGLLATGGRARVSGKLTGGHARGNLSRWANSAFNTVCVARGIRWRAHVVRPSAPSSSLTGPAAPSGRRPGAVGGA